MHRLSVGLTFLCDSLPKELHEMKFIGGYDIKATAAKDKWAERGIKILGETSEDFTVDSGDVCYLMQEALDTPSSSGCVCMINRTRLASYRDDHKEVPMPPCVCRTGFLFLPCQPGSRRKKPVGKRR